MSSANTDDNGVATIPFTVSGLGVGDHTILAEFDGALIGTTQYNSSANTARLGIDYASLGFLPPVNADGASVFATGRVIPINIRLLDANGVGGITDAEPHVYYKQKLGDGSLGTEQEAASVATPDVDNVMRYSPVDDQYIFNMDLASLPNGVYYVYVKPHVSDCALSDLGAWISVQKKGKK
ncbi:MAG: hypothetical protein ACUVXB_06285 [Bryobacteraceae bacterium]